MPEPPSYDAFLRRFGVVSKLSRNSRSTLLQVSSTCTSSCNLSACQVHQTLMYTAEWPATRGFDCNFMRFIRQDRSWSPGFWVDLIFKQWTSIVTVLTTAINTENWLVTVNPWSQPTDKSVSNTSNCLQSKAFAQKD